MCSFQKRSNGACKDASNDAKTRGQKALLNHRSEKHVLIAAGLPSSFFFVGEAFLVEVVFVLL